MVQPLRLRRATRRWLTRLDRKARDADLRVRCRVLLKVHAGQSPHCAAREIGCHPATAYRIVARFMVQGEGSVFDGRWSNGVRKVSPEVLGGIVEILRATPERYGFPRPTWTVEVLARVIAQELGVALSVGHVWKIAKQRLKARWGLPRPVVGCPWPAARRERRLAELRRLALHPRPREVVLYADEVDIHLNPKIGRDWMLPGTQRLVMTPGKNQKHYLAGAYDPLRQEFVGVDGDRKATWLFLNLLRALWLAYRWARVIHVILDNYIIHKTARVEQQLRQMGAKIRLHFLPPYCPNDNRIERLWEDLQANVTPNHRHPTMPALLAAAWRWIERRFTSAEEYAHAA
jgi:transposase